MNAARLARRWQEAAGDPARMAEAPVDEIDDPATGLVSRDFLRAELTLLRQELATLGGELRKEMAELRGDLRTEMAELRSELRQEMAQLRSDLRGEIWRVVLAVFGGQVVLVGILVTLLLELR